MKLNKHLLVLAASLLLASCGSITSSNTNGGSTSQDYDVVTSLSVDSSQWGNADSKDVTNEDADATITLNGTSASTDDTTRVSIDSSTVTITSKGIYRVSGSSSNLTIVVNDTTKSGNIYLVFNNVTMTHSSFATLYVKSADKVIVQLVGENSFKNTGSYVQIDSDKTVDGAVFSSDDITFNGEGSLEVVSTDHGIVAKDDFKMTGGTIEITAINKGVDANDSARFGGGSLTINSGTDGIHVENDELDGYIYVEDGDISITSTGGDGIYSCGKISLIGGDIEVISGGGSSKSKNSSLSTKGIKSDGAIEIGSTSIEVSSNDDAIHAAGSISITNGDVEVSSSDDGIHSDATLAISGGEVSVTKSYEGLEAETVSISGGTVSVVASDDGINAAGGSDSQSSETHDWRQGSSATGTLKISGGNIYVNASGDGLDSNGSIYISGGYTIVEGPTNGGNGALDKGDGSNCVASITGGTVLAIGTTDMAINFDSGSQCSGLVALSGSSGTTISVNDGSGFSFTASKSFACAVYSSSYMSKGNSYTITAGSSTATMNFSSGLYYSNISGGMGGGGMTPGGRR